MFYLNLYRDWVINRYGFDRRDGENDNFFGFRKVKSYYLVLNIGNNITIGNISKCCVFGE